VIVAGPKEPLGPGGPLRLMARLLDDVFSGLYKVWAKTVNERRSTMKKGPSASADPARHSPRFEVTSREADEAKGEWGRHVQGRGSD